MSTAAVFALGGHNDDRYEEEEKELSAAQKAEHARIRAGINARLAALQAEAKGKKGASLHYPPVKSPRIPGNLGIRLTKKQKQAAALAKRKATLAAKAAAIKEEEEEEDESEEIEAEGGAGSGPAAPSKKGSVRFFNMANTRNIGRPDGRVLISDRSTRKSTAGKPVIPVVNIRRSRHAGDVSALFAKMSSWAVTHEPGYLTRVLSRVKTEPHYLDRHLTTKEQDVLAAPGTITMLERQVALVDKE
jgi:hypothetical protein